MIKVECMPDVCIALRLVVAGKVLLDGGLWGRVALFDNGSFWELVREGASSEVVSRERSAGALGLFN